MPETDLLGTVVQKAVDIATSNKDALGLQEVFYGDHELVGKMPALCVEPGNKVRSLASAPSYRTDNTFTVLFLLYHSKLVSKETTKKQCIEMAEALEAVINADKTFGGLVLQGNVTAVEPGYVRRASELVYTTRLTWTGISKTRIA